MVKGNWQRRAELASKRRDDEKERKSDRKAGIKKVTSASCAESIQSTDYLATAAVHCWFVNCDENGKSAKCCATQVRGTCVTDAMRSLDMVMLCIIVKACIRYTEC